MLNKWQRGDHSVWVPRRVLINSSAFKKKTGVLRSAWDFWLPYVQVTVHCDKLRIKQPTRCLKYPTFILSKNTTCFGHLLCPSSGVICCTHGSWYVSCGLCDRFLAETGWNCQFQPVSARKWSHSPHETYQLPCVQQITPDDGHRRCPKHVVFFDKINVGYLRHLVGCFIQRI